MIRPGSMLLAALLAGVLFPAAAQPLRATLGEVFGMPAGFAGYNGRSTEGPSWDDESFRAFVAGQIPGIVRYPGGTVANYWDWHTGTYIEGSGKYSSYPYPIALFAAGLPAKTRIVYVANMVRPRPGAAGTKSGEVLAALAEFERCGRLPVAVELGNELYFKNEHAGEYAGDCVGYLRDARRIALDVQAQYPQIKLLVCTTKAGTHSRDAWNRQVCEALDSDAEFRNAVHGVVQHHYINDAYGDPSAVSDVAGTVRTITEGLYYPRQALADGSYDAVPKEMKLWITEYGVTKRNATNTWAAGLRAVAMSLTWLDWHDKLECLLWHHITASPDVLGLDHRSPGPVGIAYGLFLRTAEAATAWQRVSFPDGPVLDDGTPLLFGYKASGEPCDRLLLLNIGPQSAEADLSSLSGGKVTSFRQIDSETPYESPAVLRTAETGNLKHFYFRPFSLTLIELTD